MSGLTNPTMTHVLVEFSRLRENYSGTLELRWPAHLRQARFIWFVLFV